MKYHLTQVVLLVTILISAPSTAQQVFYVLADNATNTSCPFQPCATLSQYLLDNNGSLPIVSNVEYHFLRGEHHVPTDMVLLYLYNFAMIGCESYSSKSAVILGSLESYMQVYNSVNVSIQNLIFMKHGVIMSDNNDYNLDLYNLNVGNCFSCKIMQVIFIEYGLYGEDLLGKSYLNDIVIELIDIPICCFSGIYISYTSLDDPADHEHYDETVLVMNRISMSSINKYSLYIKYSAGIRVELPEEFLNTSRIVISNSNFHSMNHMIHFVGDTCAFKTTIKINNCIFRKNEYFELLNYNIRSNMIRADISQFNITLFFLNCKFFDNDRLVLISVQLYNWILLELLNSELSLCVNVYIFGPVCIFKNNIRAMAAEFMYIENCIVHINGPVYVSNNNGNYIISAYSSNVYLNGLITVCNNSVDTIMKFKSSHVLFINIIEKR